MRLMSARPISALVMLALGGCVTTHPQAALERKAKKLDKEWSQAVANEKDDRQYFVHRGEMIAVAADAVKTFAPLVTVDENGVTSDWKYTYSEGIDENGEWHAQERTRVAATVRGQLELSLAMAKRDESRRIRAGLGAAGWAGGDAPWTNDAAYEELRRLENLHLERPKVEGDEARFRRIASELSPKGYSVVVDEPGHLVLERNITEGSTGQGNKSATWHHKSEIELLITHGGVVDVQTRAAHRFDTEAGPGEFQPTNASDELGARNWIKALLADGRSGLTLGDADRPTPGALNEKPTDPPEIPKLRTMPEIQRLVGNRSITTNTGNYRICMAGALVPRAKPDLKTWDPDPAVGDTAVITTRDKRVPADALRPLGGRAREIGKLDDMASVQRDLPIVLEQDARDYLEKHAEVLKNAGFSQLRLPLHPDVAGRLESGDKVNLEVVKDKLTLSWTDSCIEKEYKDGIPMIRVALWDEEDSGQPETIAECELDLAGVLAKGDSGILCGDARVYLYATYLFDMDQIEKVGLPAPLR